MGITLNGLRAVAKAEGYKGSDTDHAAMKAHLLSLKDKDGNPDPIEFLKDEAGVEFEVKGLVFEDKPVPGRRRTATIAADDMPDDFDAKVKAATAATLKSLGFDPANGKRPGFPGLQVGSVKTPDERVYEARIASGTSSFKNFDHAYGFGNDIKVKAMRALGMHEAAQKIETNVKEQLTQKGYTLLTTAAGSALVPEGFDADLHQLLVQYGVARKVARVVNMTTETISRPKATGDLTMYYPADGSAGTESTKTFSNVQMRAKEGMVIVKASRAITQDAAINVADDAARDIVRCAAKQEDNTLFNSNSSGATNGYIPQTSGILFQIGAGGASASTPWVQTAETTTNSRVYDSASSTGALGVTVAELTALMALPGAFTGRMMAWHCTQQIGAAIFQRLAASVGGIQPAQIQGLGQVFTFLGAPIIYNNVMTTSLTNQASRQLLVYGDISLAADFGDRMGLAVEISEQRYWDENNIGIKGTVRHDINVHALGATGTAGPLAVLIN